MSVACRPLSDEEVGRVVESFSGRYALRDKAMFIVGIRTGYRISELLSLRIRDVLRPDGEIMDSVTVARRNVKGKTRGRTVPLHPEAKEALREWLEEARGMIQLAPDIPVFFSQKRNGQIRPLDRRTAWHILKQAYARAGILGRGVGALGTHSLRKTFASRLYDKYRDLILVQYALGHSKTENTIRYLNIREEAVARAILAL